MCLYNNNDDGTGVCFFVCVCIYLNVCLYVRTCASECLFVMCMYMCIHGSCMHEIIGDVLCWACLCIYAWLCMCVGICMPYMHTNTRSLCSRIYSFFSWCLKEHLLLSMEKSIYGRNSHMLSPENEHNSKQGTKKCM